MALNKKELIDLTKAVAKASMNPSKKFSYDGTEVSLEALNEIYRNEMKELAGTFAKYRENKYQVFELIETAIDEILPAKVLQNYGLFADVQTYAQGDKPVFKVKISEASKKRAKQFVTRVGLAGRYEVFKLDGYSFEVPTAAYGGAAQIGFEEFLDGKIEISDVFDIVLEGLDEAVYREIAKALVTLTGYIPAANSTTQSSFDEKEMNRLIMTADAYGKSTIYCTYEFAATMIPDANWASDSMKQTKWDTGYFTSYKGHSVVVLPQSFEDATNATKVIDPAYAYIIPTGAEKPIKVAFEGASAVREVESREDWSREIQTYKKFGVGIYAANPGICVYKNTSLTIANA